jgi:hypothetical protein
MAMVRSDAVQDDLMATWAEMPRSPGHAFYDRLQDLLREAGFDAFVEGVCKPYYAPRMGAPSLPPGRYFRMHTIGYFEGIDSERGIAWPGRERQGLSASQGWPRPAPVNNRRHLHPPGGGASPASLFLDQRMEGESRRQRPGARRRAHPARLVLRRRPPGRARLEHRSRLFLADGRAGAFDFAHLHAKSGSLSSLKHFAYDIRDVVRREPLPGYCLAIERAPSGAERLSFKPSPIQAIAHRPSGRRLAPPPTRHARWGQPVNSLVPSGTAPHVPSGTASSCHRGRNPAKRQVDQSLGAAVTFLTRNPSDSF